MSDNTFPGTAHTGYTSGTPTVVGADSYFSVANNHLKQVITFYIIAKEIDGGSLFLFPNAVTSTHTLICGPLSTTISPPSLLPLTALDYYEMI